MYNHFSFACVGKANNDWVANIPNQPSIRDGKYRSENLISAALGGASANVLRAISTLGSVYGDHCSTKMLTRVGQAPQEGHYTKFGQYLAAKNAYDNVRAFLTRYRVTTVDVSAEGEGSGVAASLVTNFGARIPGKAGRAITTDPDKLEIKKDYNTQISIDQDACELGVDKKQVLLADLSNAFCLAAHDLIESVKNKIDSNISDKDRVFIDTARPLLAYIAASVCVENNIPYVVDHGAKAWPKDKDTAELLSAVLKNADVLIVPDDAVVEGMKDNFRDSELLFERLTGKHIEKDRNGKIINVTDSQGGRAYNAHTVIMSNSTTPVCLYHDGEVSNSFVEKAEEAINAVGVGDTRDGALLFFLAKGEEMAMAVEKASAVATIRIQYPDNDWKDHFYEEILRNERFKKLFRDDLEELESVIVQQAPVAAENGVHREPSS